MSNYDTYSPPGSPRSYRYLKRLRKTSIKDLSTEIIDGVDQVIAALINSTVPRSLFTAKGQLLSSTAAGAPVVVPAGVDGQVLTADSSVPSGATFADPPAAGFHPFFLRSK